MLSHESGRDEAQLLVERQPFSSRVQHQRPRARIGDQRLHQGAADAPALAVGRNQDQADGADIAAKAPAQADADGEPCRVDSHDAGPEREQLRAIRRPMRP